MTLRPALALHLLCLAVLRLASLIVPRTQRSEWWREWSAELWHVREACTPSRGISWAAEREVAAFCLGAFQDARCLRAQSTPLPLPRATTMGSASQCLLLLAGLIIASLSIATFCPESASSSINSVIAYLPASFLSRVPAPPMTPPQPSPANNSSSGSSAGNSSLPPSPSTRSSAKATSLHFTRNPK